MVVAITTGLVVEVGVVVLIVELAIVVAEFKTRTGGDGLMSNESGGVTALPTLSNCPPKSNEFIEAIASWADCNVSYSIKPKPLFRNK